MQVFAAPPFPVLVPVMETRFFFYFFIFFNSGVAMVFTGIGYEMRGKYQRHHARQAVKL